MAKTPEDVRILSWKNLIPEGNENPYKSDDPRYNHTVEEWGQTEYDSGMKVGIEQGQANVLSLIMKRATELFVAGDDVEAKLLRALVTRLKVG